MEEEETKPEESTVMVVANSAPLERPVDTELDKGTEKNSDTAEEIYETIAKETTVGEEETKFETATDENSRIDCVCPECGEMFIDKLSLVEHAFGYHSKSQELHKKFMDLFQFIMN